MSSRNIFSTARSTSVTRSMRPFLSIRNVATEPRHLHVAGADNRFDGGGEKQGIDAATQA